MWCYNRLVNLSSRKRLENYVCSQIKNKLVCRAFKKVDRKLFVPKRWIEHAYIDNAIPLGGDSSISQPSLVAQMIDLLDLTGKEHVLEIGTASGYSAAILSLCCKNVDTIEIDPKLTKSAKERLKTLDFKNISVHIGDGSLGLPSKAPFDAIVVTAAAEEIPKALVNQLKEGGKLVVPVQMEEPDMQELFVCQKLKNKLIKKPVIPVRFVPLVSGE